MAALTQTVLEYSSFIIDEYLRLIRLYDSQELGVI